MVTRETLATFVASVAENNSNNDNRNDIIKSIVTTII